MLAALTLAALAADGLATEAFVPRPVAGHPVLELRLGAEASGPLEHPYLCVEGSPVDRLSFEACGNGAGFLHHADISDMAHFRGRFTVLRALVRRTSLELAAGAGFAEIQRSADAPGFQFGPARDADQVEAAGAELSISGKARQWMSDRVYVTGDLNVGGAYIPAAPTVTGGGGPLVPFAGVSAGVGF